VLIGTKPIIACLESGPLLPANEAIERHLRTVLGFVAFAPCDDGHCHCERSDNLVGRAALDRALSLSLPAMTVRPSA